MSEKIGVDAVYKQALGHFNAERYREADQLCTAIIQAAPNHIDAINLLGAVAQKVNRHDLAVELFNRAINIDSSRAVLYLNLATSLYPLGRKDETIKALKSALRIEPENSQITGYLNWVLHTEGGSVEALQQAVNLHQSGRIEEAIICYQKTLQIDPKNVLALSNMGFALQTTGKLNAAVTALKKAIAIKPDYADAYSNLGNVLQEQGEFDEAVDSYQKAIILKPDYADAYSNLGTLLKKLGELDKAVYNYQKAIDINPDSPGAHYNLGRTLHEQGELDKAVSSYQKAISIKPGFLEAVLNLGNILKELGKLDEAAFSYQKAILIKPDHAMAHSNLGVVLQEQGKVDKAVLSYKKAILYKPDYAEAYSNLGVVLQETGKLEEAVKSCQKAIAIKPDFAIAYNNLGNALRDQCKLDEAVASYQKAIEIKADYTDAFSNFLFIISYYTLYSFEETLKHHQSWDKVHGKVGLENSFSHLGSLNPDKKLKVGYISPDFKHHPVSDFMRGIIQNHNHNSFQIYCYSNVSSPDKITGEFKKLADVWRDVLGLNDQELAQQIYADGIDILIDLSGHTKKNRLKVFTYKPAPVQTTYLGYCTTTGLQAMDYWLTDPILTPDNSPEKSTETVVRLPTCWVCYKPMEPPPIAMIDRGSNMGVVYGSFNHLSKITPTVARVWSRILSALPTAKLLLKTKQLVNIQEQERIFYIFAKNGIKKERLILQKDSPDYLKEYGVVDIALDPFPRTGGLTTADALWMGVPVITLAGQRMIERQGASLLSAVGKREWIAESEDEYVLKALELAEGGILDSKQRLSLHNRVVSSPLCDYKNFVNGLERAYRQMWHLKCGTENSNHG
ncbi:MAG: tetratricopeptide repeat protein [Magnetococcales bacterium]|nr:tetratricopeptide repeat protein [Magnetococcales bacterium]